MEQQRPFKIPESVLVVIHTPALDVLLLHRADGGNHWQSVTGSKDHLDEAWEATAVREVREETGIDTSGCGIVLTDWCLENIYDIWPQWRHRYAPGVVFNRERVFGLCVPAGTAVVLSPQHAEVFARAGMSREDTHRLLIERAGRRLGEIKRGGIWRGEAGAARWPFKVKLDDDDAFVPAIGDPGDLHLIVAGGSGSPSTLVMHGITVASRAVNRPYTT